MKTISSSLIGLMLSVSISAEPLIEGRVRLAADEPVAGAIRRLTNNKSYWTGSPSWSPDGRHIAFSSTLGGESPGGAGNAIFVIGSDGTNLRRLTNYGNYPSDSFSWSPDGRHFLVLAKLALWVLDSDGGNSRLLTWGDDTYYVDHSSSSCWSPDGRHIAFRSTSRTISGDDGIAVIDSDGTNPRRLTNYGFDPLWSPDGRHIAFRTYGKIHMVGSDGTNPRFLTYGSLFSWSPDGRHIAFDASPAHFHYEEIYVIGLDGTKPRRLTNHRATDSSPSWSPDGRHIVFESDRDGNPEIYVMRSDGTAPRRLTNHRATDSSPSWSPDGRHIAFRSHRDSNGEIYVIELRQEGSD